MLYLYSFEIYNLVSDEFGQTDFSVTYRVGPPDLRRFSDKRDRKAIAQLGISDDRWRISVSTDYRGRDMQETIYLSVDLSELGSGVHLLSIVSQPPNGVTGLARNPVSHLVTSEIYFFAFLCQRRLISGGPPNKRKPKIATACTDVANANAISVGT